MRTEKQSEAARNNGKNSRGPVTPEGKRKSARNAESHNLTGGHISFLSNEDPDAFAIHQDEFIYRFQPLDGVEYDLVQKMIAASWRERRVLTMETALFEIEMSRQQAAVDIEFNVIDAPARQVLTLFGTSDAAQASALLLRYAAAARRDFAAAFRTLRELQGDRFHRKPHELMQRENHQNQPQSEPNTEPAAEPATTSAGQTQAQRQKPAIVAVIRRYDAAAADPEIVKLRNEPEQPPTSDPTTATGAATVALAA